MDARLAAYVTLDVASAILTFVVSWFFARSERLLPERGFGVLALGFAVLGLTYLASSAGPFAASPSAPLLGPIRAWALFFASVLLLLHYVGKRRRSRLDLPRVGGVALGVSLVAAALLVAAVRLGVAADAEAPLRLGAALVLVATSFLVIMEVRAKSLWDFRVPLAFVCLALSAYTVAVTALASASGAELPLVYFWRFAGLAMLLSVIWPSWRFRGAPA